MNDEEVKILELKVKDSIALRQLLTQTLVILIGGVIGLFFIENNKNTFIWIFIGMIYIVVLGKNLYVAINRVNKLLYKKRRD